MEALNSESGARYMFRRALLPIPFAAALFVLAACGNSNNNTPPPAAASSPAGAAVSPQDSLATATPIKHLVVIFGENRSFDHYFGTYPTAQNPSGEPAFTPAAGTPTPNNLEQGTLLSTNPNLNPNNSASFSTIPAGGGAAVVTTSVPMAPFRLDRSQANTEGQNHNYTAEQLAYDNGAADLFPLYTGNNTVSTTGAFGEQGLVVGFYDGNTVAAMWNYAQHFALNDNAYTDTYGPSTPGAIEVISGQNNGIVPANGAAQVGNIIPDNASGFTLIGDTDPTGDICNTSTASGQGQFGPNNKNIGDLLNAKNITWGGFMGGFDTTAKNENGTTGCKRTTFSGTLNSSPTDYVPHHNWFQYYPTTANLAHTRPTSVALVGMTDPKDSTATPVHHEYDVNDFFAAVEAGNFPSVSYIKAPSIGDAHPGNSDPLDEQAFDVKVVNFLMQQPDWKNTAVIITYDDSDGWYDHRYIAPKTSSSDTEQVQGGYNIGAQTPAGPAVNGAQGVATGADQVNGVGSCNAPGSVPGVGVTGATVNGRCGPGTRVPFLVISPFAKVNTIDDTQISQASVVKFIEDNWLGGQRIGNGSNDATTGSIMSMFNFTTTAPNAPLYLDPAIGTPLAAAPAGSATP
jgi:phospholipase C